MAETGTMATVAVVGTVLGVGLIVWKVASITKEQEKSERTDSRADAFLGWQSGRTERVDIRQESKTKRQAMRVCRKAACIKRSWLDLNPFDCDEIDREAYAKCMRANGY